MGTSLSPPWHSGIDHWSAINEAYNVKKGNGFCVRLVLCIYVTKTLMSVKFPLLNYVVEIMIGFFFSLRSFFLHSYVNTCQHVEFFNFNIKLALLDSRSTGNFLEFFVMFLSIILKCIVLYPVTSTHYGQDVLLEALRSISWGQLRKIWQST